jgi:small conductance mechanosensitive channel
MDLDLNLAETTAELGAFATMAYTWGVEFLPRLGSAIIILIVGAVLANWAGRLVTSIVGRAPHVDLTVQPILATAARYAVLIFVAVVALGQLGVQTASLLAILGAAGLAIGLALQGTLQNIAAGIMLIYLRPFRAGDYIETPALAGTIKEIGLFVTYLDTADGLFYFVPNSALWNVPLKNYTRNPRRLIMLQLRVGYDTDIEQARHILLEIAAGDPRVLRDPAPQVGVESLTDNFVILTLRAWAGTAAFADAQREIAEQAKNRLQAAGIRISVEYPLLAAIQNR